MTELLIETINWFIVFLGLMAIAFPLGYIIGWVLYG
jgi:hypothetical protein